MAIILCQIWLRPCPCEQTMAKTERKITIWQGQHANRPNTRYDG